jgi:hypothetical protein
MNNLHTASIMTSRRNRDVAIGHSLHVFRWKCSRLILYLLESLLKTFVGFDAVQVIMFLPTLLATLVSLATWAKPVTANLRITADHHSFGGVNYPQLQFFTPSHRDESIRDIVKSGARVIRLFSR